MKMKWQKGYPEKPGFYLAYNPLDEGYPEVLYYDGSRSFGWYQHFPKDVLDNVLSDVQQMLRHDLVNAVKRSLTKSEQKAIDKVVKAIDDDLEGDYTEDAWPIKEEKFEMHADGRTAIYDVEDPEYWSEIPYLWTLDDDHCAEYMMSGDPNDLMVEMEDIKASAISRIASDIESVLSKRLSDFSQPWEEKEKAPWA